MLKGDIMKEMSGIDYSPDEGVPSKAIWNPSGSMSSNSSVASTSSGSSTNETEEVTNPAAYTSSTPAAFEAALPSAGSGELKVYEDAGSEEGQADDDRMSAMMMSSIHAAHGSESMQQETKVTKSARKNDKLFGSTNDERQRFVQSMAHLNDQQLRIQLWDSFRLARVILGKPVKDKRKLSHKSILHAIRKVAEMRIQIIRMSEQLEKYRHKEKKLKRLREKQKSPQAGKENQKYAGQHQLQQQDSASISSSVLSPVSSTEFDGGPGSVREVVSDSDSPTNATTKLREHAIRILQQESDLALSQIQEMDQQRRERKRPRVDDNQEKLLGSPPTSPPPILLSPSESEDDVSYGTHESASDILYAFGRNKSQEELTVATVSLETEADEIRRVLQRVVDYEYQRQDEPEITKEASSSAQMHQDVIALLTRLTQIQPTLSPLAALSTPKELDEEKKPAAKEAETVESQPVAMEEEVKQEPLQVEVPEPDVQMNLVDEEMNEVDEIEAEIAECRELCVIDEVEEDIAECREQFAAAKKRLAESKEHRENLSLQREILEEDIVLARNNTTQNREQVQLERLRRYKKELATLLKHEEERARQLEALDAELDNMATHCVKLECREKEFQDKHEKHVCALKDFKTVNEKHTQKFRELMGSIDRGIKEQTETVLGEKHVEDITPSGSLDEHEEMAETIQRLEYNLTKKNMEIFRMKAKIMIMERSQAKPKVPSMESKSPQRKPKTAIQQSKSPQRKPNEVIRNSPQRKKKFSLKLGC